MRPSWQGWLFAGLLSLALLGTISGIGYTAYQPIPVGTAGSANANVLSVQGIASMTPILATSTVADGANVTLGAKTDAKSTATDGTSISIMSVLKEISAMVQAPPSQAVTNAGTFATQAAATLNAETTKVIGTVRVLGNIGAIFDGVMGSAVPANGVQIAGRGSGAAGAPVMTAPVVCDNWTPFSLASTTALKLVTKATSKKVYICSINLVVAGANNVALIEGTKVTNDCDTSTAGLAGGTSAATGWNFAANGGLTQGSGVGVIAASATAALDVCLLASANTQVSGVISWAQF